MGVKAELKLEPCSSSTLPRTSRGKPSRQSVESCTSTVSAIMPERNHHSMSVQNLHTTVGESSGSLASASSSKKRQQPSRVQSYRMQTTSSMAKLNPTTAAESSKDGGKQVRKGTGKFQSTPNLMADVECNESEDGTTELNSVDDKSLLSTMDQGGQKCDVEIKDKVDTESSEINGFNKLEVANNKDCNWMESERSKFSDRDIMPPPSTTMVLTTVQSSFITKATKFRRSMASEQTFLQAKDILPGKFVAPAVSTIANGEVVKLRHSPVPASSELTKQDLDVSPMELPVRDTDISRGKMEIKLNISSNVPKPEVKPLTDGLDFSGQSEVSSAPTVIKIGRCISPVRPLVGDYGMNKNRITIGSASFAVPHRRMLPAEPKHQQETVIEKSDNAKKWTIPDRQVVIPMDIKVGNYDPTASSRPSSLDSGSSSLLSHKMKSEVTAAEVDDKFQSPSSKSNPAVSSRPTPGSPRTRVLSTGTNYGRASPFGGFPISPPEEDSSQAWVSKAQRIQHQWEQRQQMRPQTTEYGTPTVSSKTEDIIGEIERQCEELRSVERSADPAENLVLSDQSTGYSTRSLTRRASGEVKREKLAFSLSVPGEKESSELAASTLAKEQWEKATQIPNMVRSTSRQKINSSMSSLTSPDDVAITDSIADVQPSIPPFISSTTFNDADKTGDNDKMMSSSMQKFNSIGFYPDLSTADYSRQMTAFPATLPRSYRMSTALTGSSLLTHSKRSNASEEEYPNEGEPEMNWSMEKIIHRPTPVVARHPNNGSVYFLVGIRNFIYYFII